MDIAERLIAFKDYTGLTNSQFADKAGIPRPTLSQFLNGRNKRLSDDLAAKLHNAYPELNVLWLLFGEGSMVLDENIEISEPENTDFSASAAAYISENEVDSMPRIDSPVMSKSEANEKTTPQNDLFIHSDSTKAFGQPTEIGFDNPATSPTPKMPPAIPADPTKKIQSIMVFYSDSSYEIFTPASGD